MVAEERDKEEQIEIQIIKKASSMTKWNIFSQFPGLSFWNSILVDSSHRDGMNQVAKTGPLFAILRDSYRISMDLCGIVLINYFLFKANCRVTKLPCHISHSVANSLWSFIVQNEMRFWFKIIKIMACICPLSSGQSSACVLKPGRGVTPFSLFSLSFIACVYIRSPRISITKRFVFSLSRFWHWQSWVLFRKFIADFPYSNVNRSLVIRTLFDSGR